MLPLHAASYWDFSLIQWNAPIICGIKRRPGGRTAVLADTSRPWRLGQPWFDRPAQVEWLVGVTIYLRAMGALKAWF